MGVLHDPAPRSAEPGGPDALSPSSWRRPWRTRRQATPPRRPWRVWAALPLPPLRLMKRQLLVLGLLTLVLFADLIAAWPIVQPSTAFALAFKNPNPALSAPSWLNPPTAVKQPNLSKSSTAVTVPVSSTSGPHTWTVSMKPLILHLGSTAQKAASSDGQLEVDLPASSLDATQLRQAGGIQLAITQVKPASGRTDNGGFISFGTYEFQFFDGAGNALSGVRLRHPFTVTLHLPQDQQMVWSGQQVSTQWAEVKGAASLPAVTAQAAVTAAGVAAVEPQVASTSKPVFAYAQRGANGRDWSVQSSLSSSVQQTSSDLHSQVVMATTQAVQASTVAFNTQAPQATWGTPTLPQVGLNAGGLNYSYPLSIPAGPGGFQPTLQLN
ncbi:MAG TPA: hypothetical protein VHD63_07755, partial [Ktedonobacteraceae bacterium]|nr:hypothetical protein [Ktedonobacteraceae bacterium]